MNWKNNSQCAFMLTVDFDAETLWLSRDPNNAQRPGTLSQGHFGAKVGVPLLLKLFAEEGLKTTFFIPGWVIEKYPRLVRQIHQEGHEIGHHGYLHEWVDPTDPEKEEAILTRGIEIIKGITGEKPLGYRSPAWEVSANMIGLLGKYQFLYSSNMMDDLNPYSLEIDGRPTGLIELPVQWILDDAPFFLFSVRPPSRPIIPNQLVLPLWKEEFAGIYQYGGLYNIVVHPQFSGRPSRVNMLRELIRYARSFPNVWFATGREAAQYWKENHN